MHYGGKLGETRALAERGGLKRGSDDGALIAEAEGKVYRGHEGVREWWSGVAEALGGLEFEAVEIREVGGDGVIAKMHVRGEISEVPIEQTMWQAALVRELKPYWWQAFRTEAEAYEALEARRRRER